MKLEEALKPYCCKCCRRIRWKELATYQEANESHCPPAAQTSLESDRAVELMRQIADMATLHSKMSVELLEKTNMITMLVGRLKDKDRVLREKNRTIDKKNNEIETLERCLSALKSVAASMKTGWGHGVPLLTVTDGVSMRNVAPDKDKI